MSDQLDSLFNQIDQAREFYHRINLQLSQVDELDNSFALIATVAQMVEKLSGEPNGLPKLIGPEKKTLVKYVVSRILQEKLEGEGASSEEIRRSLDQIDQGIEVSLQLANGVYHLNQKYGLISRAKVFCGSCCSQKNEIKTQK